MLEAPKPSLKLAGAQFSSFTWNCSEDSGQGDLPGHTCSWHWSSRLAGPSGWGAPTRLSPPLLSLARLGWDCGTEVTARGVMEISDVRDSVISS